jgi:hypothetical protein
MERLIEADPVTRPMFGCIAVYIGPKIIFIMRDKKSLPEANGVWLATSKEHHASLRKDFPSMTSVYILSEGKSETNWQMIPLEADDFEESVIKACEFVLHDDPRIGRIPKARKRKTRPS